MPDIDLRVEQLEQLFDSLDPAPFHAKALDRSAEAYLIESAGEYGAHGHLAVVIHAPVYIEKHLDDVASAIHAHFALACQQANRRHQYRRRIGRIALAAGGTILAAALLLRRWVEAIGGSFGDVLAEGLQILAWVALWRPIETIGFDSWEAREQRRILKALSKVPIRFEATSASDPPAQGVALFKE